MLKDWGHDLGVSYQYQFMGTTYEFMWNKMIQELNLPYSLAECIAEMNQRRAALIKKDGYLPIKNTKALIKRLKSDGLRLRLLKCFVSGSKIQIISHKISQTLVMLSQI